MADEDRKLLTEVLYATNISILEDAKDGDKLMKISGEAGRAGIINQNDRMYSLITYTKAVERAQYKIKAKKLLGQIDHPEYGHGSLRKAAIRFTKLEMDGDKMRFEAVVLPTPDGEVLKGLLRGGVGVGMSTRGYASVDYQMLDGREIAYIKDDYEIEGIDAVLEESNPYGKIQNYESRGGKGQMKTVEELRAAYPELVKAIEEAYDKTVRESITKDIKTGLEKEFDMRVTKAVDEKKEEIRKDVLESEDVKKAQTAVQGVLTALGDFVPKDGAPSPVAESVQKEVRTLKESVKDLTTKLETAQAEKKALEEASEAAEVEKKAKAKLDEKLKGERFAEQIRPHLESCKTPEEVESKFKDAKALVESVMKAQGIKLDGEGEAPNPNPDKPQFSEEVARQRRLAGIVD